MTVRHPVKIVGHNNDKITMFYSKIPETRHTDSEEFLMWIFENHTDNMGYDLPECVYVIVRGPIKKS